MMPTLACDRSCARLLQGSWCYAVLETLVFLFCSVVFCYGEERIAHSTMELEPSFRLGLGPIQCAALSPDGNTLAVGGAFGIAIIDTKHREIARYASGNRDRSPVYTSSLSFSKDGRWLASGHGYFAYLWDIESWSVSKLLDPKDSRVIRSSKWKRSAVAFTPDSSRVLTFIGDNIEYWECESGELEGAFEVPASRYGDSVDQSPSVKFSADCRLFITALRGRVSLWSLPSQEKLYAFRNEAWGEAVVFSPDGAQVFCDALWDTRSLSEVRRFARGDTRAASFSPLGQELACGYSDGSVVIWNIDTGLERTVFGGHTESVVFLGYCGGGDELVSVSMDGSICFREAASGNAIKWFRGHLQELREVGFLDDKTILTISEDGSNLIWDYSESSIISSLGHARGYAEVRKGGFHKDPGAYYGLCVSPDKRFLLAEKGEDGIVCVNVNDMTEVGLPGVISGRAGLTRGGRALIIVGMHELSMFEIGESRRMLCIRDEFQLGTGDRSTRAVTDVSPDGTLLAAAMLRTNAIRLYDTNSGEVRNELQGHGGAINYIAFSDDGRLLVSCSQDMTTRIWEVQSGEAKYSLSGHQGGVLCADFSSDRRLLATGSSDFTTRLWDLSTGLQLSLFRAHSASVLSVDISPNSSFLASASEDRTALVWGIRGIISVSPDEVPLPISQGYLDTRQERRRP